MLHKWDLFNSKWSSNSGSVPLFPSLSIIQPLRLLHYLFVITLFPELQWASILLHVLCVIHNFPIPIAFDIWHDSAFFVEATEILFIMSIKDLYKKGTLPFYQYIHSDVFWLSWISSSSIKGLMVETPHPNPFPWFISFIMAASWPALPSSPGRLHDLISPPIQMLLWWMSAMPSGMS